MPLRSLCPDCHSKPVAINYIRNGITYYRSKCDACIRKFAKIKPKPPLWVKAGYKKKPHCEKCGFVAVLPNDQLHVFHVDGNLKNVEWANLKTVCLNCQPVIYKSKLPWKPSAPV